MRALTSGLLLTGLTLIAGQAVAQDNPNGPVKFERPAPGPMTFFLTSVGLGKGGDLGGLEGADRHCQALAEAASAGKYTWRAYLSLDAANGKPAVNARDRIGPGPWYNAKGARIGVNVGDVHGDTLEQARKGNLINQVTALTERGEIIGGERDKPNKHDVLTGSQADGTAYTDGKDHACRNWTSSSSQDTGQVGHHDRQTSFTSGSWNSAHPTNGCSQQNLIASGGDGLFYCFAAGPR